MKYLIPLFFVFVFQVDDTDKQLANFKKTNNNLTNIDYYDSVIEIKKDGEIVKLKSLDDFEQKVFLYKHINDFEKTLSDTQDSWEGKLIKDKTLQPKIKTLFDIRCNTAVKAEEFIESFFDTYANHFEKTEIDFLKKKMRSFHDNNNLIKR